tara:strand:- start:109 stop:1302 length:1194 start_codon:yes stop_codon:yes gene_type:complete
MLRIYNLILKLVKSEWTFRSLNNSDILIYDQVGSENIIPLINKKINYTILNTRFERLNFFIFFSSILNFLRFKINNQNFYKNYLIEFIKASNPKIIMTFIDNDLLFYSLKKEFPKIYFICIQNGLSANKININDLQNLKKIDHFFCFSEIFARFYKKNIAQKTHVIGSLKCNEHSKKNFKTKDRKKLIFISSYSNFKDYKFFNKKIPHTKFYKPESILLPIIFSFCLENKINLSILLKTNKIEAEKNFYFTILKKQLNLSNHKYLKFYISKKKKLSYEIIKKFDLVTSIDSFLGLEAISLNIKSLFFPIRGMSFNNKTFTFGWPQKMKKNGFCWLNSISKKKVNNILKKNLNLTHKKWMIKVFENNFRKIIFYDYQNKKTKKLVNEILISKIKKSNY